MTERSASPARGSAQAERNEPLGRTAFTAAVVLALSGALLRGLGPLAGLVVPDPAPAYPSWPLLLVLALLAPAASLWLRARGRDVVAAAVLVGPAALAPGRAVHDAQLALDASALARPELLRPERLAAFTPGTGMWLLLAGHVAVLAAGVLAARSITRDTAGDGPQRQGLLAVGLVAGALAAVAALMASYSSDDPYVVPTSAVDGPPAVLAGSLLLALAVPVAAGLAVGSTDPDVARGGLLGLALGLVGVFAPAPVTAAVLADFQVGWGPVLGSLAALALAALAVPAGRRLRAAGERRRELQLPAHGRLLALTAVLACLSGVSCLVAAATSQLRLPGGMEDPAEYPARLLWVAGGLLLVLGAAVLVRGWAERIRPVLAVAWAVVPLSCAAVLDSVFTAVQVADAAAGPGAWACGAALVLAVLAAVAAALAGAVERDEVDLTEIAMRRDVLPPCLVALVLGAGAFSFPVVDAPDYTPPGVFSAFGTTSWGLLVAVIAVVGASVVAPLSRPARAASLLTGAASVVAVRVAQYPLTVGRLEGSWAGPGLWLGLAALVVLLVAAGLAGRAQRPAAARPPGS
ncbi:hypothetical protein [Salinifilum ghardaiensis]